MMPDSDKLGEMRARDAVALPHYIQAISPRITHVLYLVAHAIARIILL